MTEPRSTEETTRQVYRQHAAGFDARRPKGLHERIWLDRFTALLPPAASVLDLGCGAGEPIALHLVETGLAVTGLDSSEPMLDLARARLPGATWIHGDMRALALGQTFDGILGWNSFFHLTPDEQRQTLPRIAAHLNPGGALMLTVGPEAGERMGQVCGAPVYHSSLAPHEYALILHEHGLCLRAFVAEDPDCDRQTILLAKKA